MARKPVKVNPFKVRLHELEEWLAKKSRHADEDSHSYAVESLVNEFCGGKVHHRAARSAHDRRGAASAFAIAQREVARMLRKTGG